MIRMRMGIYANFWIVLLFVISMVGSAGAQQPSVPDAPRLKSNKTKRPATAQKFHEDWTSITLEGSNLLSEPPVLGERTEPPDGKYIRERLQLYWRPKDPLDLYVILPKGVKKPPVILYLYSFPQDTKRFQDDHWCAGLTSGGYAAVGFVSAFTGHRLEYRNPTQSFIGDLQEALATSTHDVQMILNYLASRGDLDMDRVGMYGQGSGGTIAILASAADPRIRALDVLTPWGDWPEWVGKAQIVPKEDRAKYLAPEYLEKVAPLDPVKWFPRVKAQSVRIEDVREDPNMSPASQERMEAAAAPITEINQIGDFRALMPLSAGGRLFDWLRAQLKPDAKPQMAADRSQRVHFYPAMTESLPRVPSDNKP